MDKKSANGFQTKGNEGNAQRKQLPYSVETPYGFHLDLDFLKYVDDIEKGNTIKRVHIQRRVKGPPKFSTLPRNFSLPGHGVRPAPKEKDITWSGTSTLGPKPRSRVTEVQQIFDFRANDGGTSLQSSRLATGQGTGYVSVKPRDQLEAGFRNTEEKTVEFQSRPNLLRASSMPGTLQQRKGSDSSSPERIVGTPESGSTENMFRASPEITDRRCVPQDRTGIHQQITVALKRVRELEEQVKTIPELKAQICSLKEEREKLLLQLQAQAQAQASTSPSTIVPSSDSRTQPQGHKSSEGLSLALMAQPTGSLESSGSPKVAQGKERQGVTEKSRVLLHETQIKQEHVKGSSAQSGVSKQESERQIQLSEISDNRTETIESPWELVVRKPLQDIAQQELTSITVVVNDGSSTQESHPTKEGKPVDQDRMQKLHEELMRVETKLTQASQELDRTNILLKEQLEENRIKEERILQLSEGIRVEEAQTRPRRASTDTGTETERVDFSNQETETESTGTIDQGTDTDRICIEVSVPIPMPGSIDQGVGANKGDTSEQVTETDAEIAAASPQRPRANSMERGTVTESITTEDQTTETPAAQTVNQVTETEEETTDHPQRPRASSVDRETETDRVDTVDRVTETEVAQREDQQTETEITRRQDSNPGRGAEAESQVGETSGSERLEDVKTTVSENVDDEDASKQTRKDSGDSESMAVNVVTESLVEVSESKVDRIVVSDIVTQDDRHTSPESTESKSDTAMAKKDSETKAIISLKNEVADISKTQQIKREIAEKKQNAEGDIKPAIITETTVTVAVTAVKAAMKAVAPVRPQRGRKPSSEQAQPSPPQPQAAPMRPRRGSSETQAQQSQSQTKVQPQTEAQGPSQLEAQPPRQLSESQIKPPALSLTQVEDSTSAKRPPGDSSQKESQSQPQAQGPCPSSRESQPRTKSVQSHPQTQTTTTRSNSKELKATQKGSSITQPPSRLSGEARGRMTRQGSSDSQTQSPGSRRSSTESRRKDGSETQSLRRVSGETAHRGSSETQASRRDTGEAQHPRRGSGESPTSPAALGQVVTRLTGLIGEQWAQLGSSSGTQQTTSVQESLTAPKQTTAKRVEAAKGTSAKPAGKTVPATATTTTGKPVGKPGPSKMSSIQSQLVSSLSVLSAFYSPGQKAAAASKQQEQGLKSIMKKNGIADKPGNKGAKKNLKFVGVNGGYETTSSEESSGDEKPKVEVEEEDSSEPEVEKEKEMEEKPEEGEEPQSKDAEASAEGGGGAAAAETGGARGLLDQEGIQDLLEEESEGEKVEQKFIDACIYVKDRMEEVSSPDKDMRQVLVALYQEWFRVSSQKDSKADTVRSYLGQVGLTTPTLLPYVVNLTDGNGNMALHYSVSHSNFPVVRLLLDTGLCETDNVNKAGYTPVMLAALTAAESPDDLEVAQQLLKQGDVNACSRQAGQTALMLAVSHGRVAMVKLLLSSGADVNAQDREGSTALMCASEHGHTHIVRLLLETDRCDLRLTDKNGQTAESVAEGASHQDIVDLLRAQPKIQISESPSTTDLL
ncbi:KN motif and ankyrin repeat domain-containing protein 1 [Brachionichthys hirsutus]|uniref:KN motif and ankyrin repeat domain-containing protein 1 n=1 Tax=Brachionichthys hirsutus TaxID=412623 RepID=UPI0036054034